MQGSGVLEAGTRERKARTRLTHLARRVAITIGLLFAVLVIWGSIEPRVPHLGNWLIALSSTGAFICSLRHREWTLFGYSPKGWRWLLGIVAGLFLSIAVAPPRPPAQKLSPRSAERLPTPPRPSLSPKPRGQPVAASPHLAVRSQPPAQPIQVAPHALPIPAAPPQPRAPTPVVRLSGPVAFSEYRSGEPLRAAQDALNAGDTMRAGQLYFARDRRADDARVARFKAALDRVWNQQNGTNPAADFVYRASKYWNAEIDRLPVRAPANEAGWRAIMPNIETLSQSAADAERMHFTPSQHATVVAFIRRLSARQSQTLPAVRRHVADTLRRNWFRLNVDVNVTGPGGRTLQLTSPMFANNANIEDVQQGVGNMLRQVRFRRVEYRWARISGVRYYSYSLDVPRDDQVAFWNPAVSGFHIVNIR